MARNFMVGTLDDKPLLIVDYDEVRYFVSLDDREVFLDEPGLPIIEDEDIIAEVLEKADSL